MFRSRAPRSRNSSTRSTIRAASPGLLLARCRFQLPSSQNGVAPLHCTPQPPQFIGSLIGLTHLPPQHAW